MLHIQNQRMKHEEIYRAKKMGTFNLKSKQRIKTYISYVYSNQNPNTFKDIQK